MTQAPTAGGAAVARAPAQRSRDLAHATLPRRYDAEDDAGDDGDRHRERERYAIHANFVKPRHRGRSVGDNGADRGRRDQQPERAANGREQHAFRQHLPDEARGARAEG